MCLLFQITLTSYLELVNARVINNVTQGKVKSTKERIASYYPYIILCIICIETNIY